MLIASLKVFCDLIETQSFSRTAALNSVTQSAVSQQLKSIEKRQKNKLIEREKRKLTLTAEGEIFYQSAREIVRRYEEMENQIQSLGGIVSGTVRLASIYSVGMLELAPYLKAYLKYYSKVNFRLQYNQAKKIYDDVSKSEIDLGIVSYPRPRGNIEVVPFIQDRLSVVCHPSNQIASLSEISPKELGQHPIILFTQETPTRQAIDQFFRKHGVKPKIVMELDHIATIKHAVEVDIGISIVPANAIKQEKEWGTLKDLPFQGEPFDRPLGILYRRGRSLSLATQKLLDILTEKP